MNTHLSTREKGNKAEDIACEYLESRGFSVAERNYLKKWGEIDIIAFKDRVLHFVEVKSATGNYRPEENVHLLKQKKLRKIIQTYLNEKKFGEDFEFQFHVIAITFVAKTGKVEIKMLENLIL